MDTLVITVFAVVYVGMILGRIPGLALDRTGVALLGAITLLAFGRVGTGDLTQAVDIPTIALLFGLMVISAQFRLAGFYSQLVRWAGRRSLSPSGFLALILVTTAVLSAILINDIICLALAPVVIELCTARSLNPRPFLLGVACAANVGSAATLIGNPQNILIGQVLHLSFSRYLIESFVPVAAGLALVWAIIRWQYRGRWQGAQGRTAAATPPFDGWQTAKAAIVTLALVVIFLGGWWPRELTALAGAAVLLLSRRMRSREMLGLVDWQLLVLFVSLFIVNFALRESGHLFAVTSALVARGVDLGQPAVLFGTSFVLSNIVSNVPAVMLLLPMATHPSAGLILALSSTLAGNLIIVGSIANIIVVEQAACCGVHIGWREHAKTGVPVTLATLAVAAVWIWLLVSGT